MFIKITKAKTNQYVQLVRSYREDGRVKHKVVLNLGKLEQIENNPSFQRLAKRLAEISKLQR
jgi:UDP-N-acetyl-D-mannosaminuronic acid transferase (WecB/TagA/CpsF family)